MPESRVYYGTEDDVRAISEEVVAGRSKAFARRGSLGKGGRAYFS
jgi:hypothetical protein